ncbi:SAC3 family protein B isoform X2 [Ziziphus jujuba]|uniref:SAC3 family protein B isoform X2 n=1 Tax=Ziziphus jujuba TaxID=326968 RepID=A0A6P4A0X0_ZIZJJ|nr:SAC3 family protein B isoform X2 [Ziziphus jujuba]
MTGLGFGGFANHPGPTSKPADSFPVFGNPARSPSLSTPTTPPFSDSPPLRSPSPFHEWGNGQRSFFENDDRRPMVTTLVANRNSGTSVTAKATRFHEIEQGVARNHFVPPRAQTPEFASKNSHPVEGFHPSSVENVRPASPSPSLDGRPKFSGPYTFSQATVRPSVSPYDVDFLSETDDAQVSKGPKRMRSPTMPSAIGTDNDHSHFPRNNYKKSNVIVSTHESQAPQRSPPSEKYAVYKVAATNPTSFAVTKRSRSPPLLSEDVASIGNPCTTQDGTEREIEAKAKRLARFRVELGENMQTRDDDVEQKVSANKLEKDKLGPDHSEYESLKPSGIITGLCTDMCPESERAERERKGDLDQFERLDGDRNQTSKHLAVKKYNRMAEREADLIRPMPILQKTIDYLLNLLDQPYNDKFLGIYNFLWDRMRAIRMDLRMQHIFNQGAITMLEQMIRLHIIAMHELCEYSKGEGFSEGFDAHLNIEQMNKTSVELFHLYDDHRKKGMHIPTEKEFRGYYALLKLDKHPGYIVEPAELSLDLAKMTPEIRQTEEVLFARDVARACRTGNFISFFRLARKASYLQACLMHAHFAKLRTQALASLHAGLQNNQGLPLAHVAKWLAMEEEDLESLLEYHGFVIKVFEEPYMVKEGTFINGDKDYPTRRSKLVDFKRSGRIIEDVLPSIHIISMPFKVPNEMAETSKSSLKSVPSVEKESFVSDIPPAIEMVGAVSAVDEDLPDIRAAASQKECVQPQPIIKAPVIGQQSKDDHQMSGILPLPWGFSFTKVDSPGKPKDGMIFRNSLPVHMDTGTEGIPLQRVSETAPQESSLVGPFNKEENSVPQTVLNKLEDEVPPDILQKNENYDLKANYQHEEITEAKLKLIIRIWKRRSSKQRQLREQRQLASVAALSSLSLGPPIHLLQDQPSVSGKFDIDQILRERSNKHGQSWSTINVSEEIVDTLSRRNPDARCLCWKLIVCSHLNNLGEDKLGQRNQDVHPTAGSWLLAKLLTSNEPEYEEGLVISSAGLSTWRKCIHGQSGKDMTCCWSVVKNADFHNLTETVSGASAVLFLASKSIPWKLQKDKLYELLMSIPSGSYLPLLILSDSYKDGVSDLSSIIVNELGLHDIDKSRIGSFFIVFLVENQQVNGFFSDKRLREGLQWLASESPRQLVLHYVKTRELVLSHWNSSFKVLRQMKDYEIDPNDLVLAFNEALDQSLEEISAAAKENRIGWPCPEISLLGFSDEYRIIESYIPKIGWSSVDRIQLLISALQGCKLPVFPDGLSCLSCGSSKEIKNQLVKLENSLIMYLSKMMGIEFALREAHVMLQRHCKINLLGSSFYIVPNWFMILWRITNWRLMGVSYGASSSAYILERPDSSYNMAELDCGLSPIYSSHPSLDEMIEVGFSGEVDEAEVGFSEVSGEVQEAEVGFSEVSGEVQEAEVGFSCEVGAAKTSPIVEDESSLDKASDINSGLDSSQTLSLLLDKCEDLQSILEEKLYIYF